MTLRITIKLSVIGIMKLLKENQWIPGPGHEFTLTFFFDDNDFLVYTNDDNRNYHYKFGYQFDIGDIHSIQVWDDVEYINEITFRYKKETE